MCEQILIEIVKHRRLREILTRSLEQSTRVNYIDVNVYF